MPNKHGEPTEKEIQSGIRDYFNNTGWFVIRIQQGLGCMPGISDLIAIKCGIVVFIEVKTNKGKQSEHQLLFDKNITAHGGHYAVLRSIEDAVELVKWLEKRKGLKKQ